MFAGYGRQKGWEREELPGNIQTGGAPGEPATDTDNGEEKTPDGFELVTEQMELPF